MSTAVIVVNVLSLVLLIAGVVLVATRQRDDRDVGVLLIVCGMILAVVGLILAVTLYQGWLPA